MVECMWCADGLTHANMMLNIKYSHLFNCENHKENCNSAEAHRSFFKESRYLDCEYCGMGFSTPAESTDHAQSHHRHFCFVCGVEALVPGRKLPGQHCRVVGHDQNSVKADAKTPRTTSPQIKIEKLIGHRPRSYNSPYSTQHRNIQAEKDLYLGKLLRRLGGVTGGQRACIEIKAAGSGQMVDYISDRDLLHLALAIRSPGAYKRSRL